MSNSPLMMSEVTIEDVITNCEDIDLETNADNLRAVHKVMTEKESEYYIPPKAWKQQVEFFGADKMKEFIELGRRTISLNLAKNAPIQTNHLLPQSSIRKLQQIEHHKKSYLILNLSILRMIFMIQIP